MVNISKLGDSTIKFTFTDNDRYLYNGEITLPLNSLILEFDTSDLVIFKKIDGDVFVTFLLENSNFNSKDELIAWYKANMVGSTGGGGGGVTSGEVQTMIDESISGKVDADFDNSLGFDINDDLGVYAEGNGEDIVFNTASSKVKEYTFPSVYTNGSNNIYKVGFNSNVSLELNQSFSGTVSATQAIGVKYLDTNDELKECWWDYSNNAFTINSDYSANNSVKLTYISSIHRISLGRQNNSLKTIITIMVGGDYYIASSSNPTEADCYISYIKIYTSIKKLQSVLNEKQRQLTAGDGIKLDYSGNISANIKVTGDTHTANLNSESATTYLMFDGINSVDMWLNQSYTGTPSGWYTIGVRNPDYSYDYYLYESDTFTLVSGSAGSTLNYDSSTGKVTITCPSGIAALQNGSKFAPANDLTNADCFIGLVSYTSNEYTIQEAIDNKQDTLSAGRGISITTGETADTVSFNLPISAGTGSKSIVEGESTLASGYSSHAEGAFTKANGSNSHAEGKYSQASGQSAHAEGDNTRANGIKSHAEGSSTVANGSNSHVEGSNTIANNESEHASGKYNVSNTGESTSAQTLFSVGNGGWDEAAQDVVRHNAFEIRKNGDIYFFDGANDVKLQDAIPTTTSAVTSGSTDVVTSGGVYAKMGGMTIVKITESDYQSLSVKDPDTLYVVIPDPTNP